MCGSVALLNTSTDTEHVLRNALHLLESRGPDGSGVAVASHGAIGHCRLALRDEAAGGQPIQLSDGRTMSYVGELYNENLLRNILKLSGWAPTTASDTEILSRAIESWGDKVWNKLDAMFAIMLLSEDGSRLQLVRDRFGVKPIFFARSESNVAAASQPSALREIGYCRAASLPTVLHFLKTSQITLNDRTVWQDVKLAPPGSLTTLSVESASQIMWAEPLTFGITENSGGDKSSRLTHLLSEAVYRQSQADTPVGVFLSGGVDSSILAALFANMRRETIHTFAIALEGDTEDLEYARKVAKHVKSEHVETVISPEEFFERTKELTKLRALPVSLPNEVLIYRLSLEAKAKVKAVLSGEGADELFGGYHRLQSRLRNSNGTMHDLLASYREATSWFNELDLRQSLRDPSALEEVKRADFAELSNLLVGVDAEHAARALLIRDHFPHLLLRLDGASMSGSIEGRVPFTDNDVVKLALSLSPAELLPAFGLEKPVLRKSGVGLLPEEVLRRPKRAFNASLNKLFESKAGQFELNRAKKQSLIAKLFDSEKLEQILTEDRETQVFHRTWLICSLSLWSELCGVSEIN